MQSRKGIDSGTGGIPVPYARLVDPCAGYLGHPFRKRDKILGEDQHCVKKSEQAAFNFILSKSVH